MALTKKQLQLNEEFDRKLGIKAHPKPWHNEDKLSKQTKQALDSLGREDKTNPSHVTDNTELEKPEEKEEKHTPHFYKETPQIKKAQDDFDKLVKHTPAQGTGTWKAGPVSKRERLLAWHKAIGSPQHVIDKELADLEKEGN